ncbi:mechanosensitive ion channel family protein [Amnibacterium endophyticum]|uniref:Mechanosensitive ion channel family protein n=1 Tax=Amnibacterium endophyticum TaxID=2109337 RepID=A0ABW4LCK2_9MICO
MAATTVVPRIEVLGETLTLGGIVTAAVVLVIAIAAAAVLRGLILRRSRQEGTAHPSTWYTLSRLTTYTVLVAGVLLAVSALGVPLGRFAVLFGALGVGIGFGLQPLFANFIAGIVLLLDRSLKVGDFVELESGTAGEVREIALRATTIVTNDNLDILVPNAEFVSGRVVNWTHRDVRRRLRVPFGVAYDADKEAVKAAALEAAAAVPFTLDQDGPLGPQVWLSGFGDSALEFELVVWLDAGATRRPVAVTAAYNWALHTALQRHGLEIPFPQRDLHVRSLFGLTGEEARAALRLEEPERERREAGGAPAEARNDAVDDVAGRTGYTPERADGEEGRGTDGSPAS